MCGGGGYHIALCFLNLFTTIHWKKHAHMLTRTYSNRKLHKAILTFITHIMLSSIFYSLFHFALFHIHTGDDPLDWLRGLLIDFYVQGEDFGFYSEMKSCWRILNRWVTWPNLWLIFFPWILFFNIFMENGKLTQK